MKELYGMFMKMEAEEQGHLEVKGEADHGQSADEPIETMLGEESGASPMTLKGGQHILNPRTVVQLNKSKVNMLPDVPLTPKSKGFIE